MTVFPKLSDLSLSCVLKFIKKKSNIFQYINTVNVSRSANGEQAPWLKMRLNFMAAATAKYYSVNTPSQPKAPTTDKSKQNKLNKTIWIQRELTHVTVLLKKSISNHFQFIRSKFDATLNPHYPANNSLFTCVKSTVFFFFVHFSIFLQYIITSVFFPLPYSYIYIIIYIESHFDLHLLKLHLKCSNLHRVILCLISNNQCMYSIYILSLNTIKKRIKKETINWTWHTQ